MPKYFDSDELLKKLPDDLPYKASVKRVLIQAPEADVVPKSEVERLQSQVNRLKKYDEERDIALHARLIAETRAKVAREIFEELLKEASLRFDGFRNTIIFPLNYYNELKKKYTE